MPEESTTPDLVELASADFDQLDTSLLLSRKDDVSPLRFQTKESASFEPRPGSLTRTT